jgi:uncharacterized 2Fe-2S/4Fe-4S cluster protein (DUF4445 family)
MKITGPVTLRPLSGTEELAGQATQRRAGDDVAAALDLGTTTISAVAMERGIGEEIGRGVAPNPQRVYGADVASRVAAAIGGQSAALRHRAVAGMAAALDAALSAPGSAASCGRLVIAGNSVMTHLALGRSVAGLAAYPYEPAFSGVARLSSAEIGLELLPPGCEVVFLPAVSAFVGGDVTAGVIATGLDRPGGVRVLIDLGTNAEVVVSVDGTLTASSAAAGPAFEAAGLACGGPAAPGAIEAVAADENGDFAVRVIGDVLPGWLCGSGALSLVASLLDLAHIDADGRMWAKGPLEARFHTRGDLLAFQVAGALGGGTDVYLTQLDVRELQLAKAAVSAALAITLSEAGVLWDAVDEILVAGAFGEGVGSGLLARVGVVPLDLRAKVSGAGNTSLIGATAICLDEKSEVRAEAVASRARSLELALSPAFQRTFLDRMAFPVGGTRA